ncbi:MAG: pyruvate dehydrogenase (acetyl-transferring) E1 component subunit alpha [Alphaproteobacteria bacterium]
MSIVASFEITYTGYLAPDGTARGTLPALAGDRDALIGLYRAMALTRAFDAKAIAMQRAGQLGTYASSLGQEAVACGIGAAMAAGDVLLPSFREHGTQIMRGVTMEELFLFWGGDERGHDFAGPRQDFPVSVPVGSHAQHAVGVALALKLRHESRAAVCVFGDGATSKGDVAEALNAAGVWRLPAVFVVTNNQWAISVPRDRQTAAETLAQKAVAAGLPGHQVDGNDAIAVCHVVGAALDRARTGGGPTLIEALTYRLADHTTADDASHYRDPDEVSRRWAEEPVSRLRAYLTGQGWWSKDDERALLSACAATVDTAAETFLEMPPQPPQAIFDFLYEKLPEPLAAQRAACLREAGEDG